jgi:serine protease Do
VAGQHASDLESQGMLGINGEDDPKGALVTLVFPRSPADRAGLKSGDVVTDFNGQKVADFKGLQKLIDASRPGNVVDLRVLREQKSRQIRATIAARPRE